MSFKTFLEQYELLLELSSNTPLYHRSPIKLKVGDKIKPKKDKEGHHWLEDKEFEKALEYYRQTEHKDKPSRFEAIYSTPIPRSRFTDKGYLYVVKPTGKMFMTDSGLIDIMAREFSDRRYGGFSDPDFERKYTDEELTYQFLDQYNADKYWKGGGIRRNNIEDAEVLSEGAEVLEYIPDNERRLRDGDKVTVNKSGVLGGSISVYMNKFESNDPVKKEIEEFVKSEVFDRKGKLKKGTKLELTSVKSTLNKGYDDIVGGILSRGKYDYLRGSVILKKLNKYKDLKRAEIFISSGQGDISQYLDIK